MHGLFRRRSDGLNVLEDSGARSFPEDSASLEMEVVSRAENFGPLVFGNVGPSITVLEIAPST